EGLEGKLFKPVALSIVFALSGSLVLALTVIPVAGSVLLGRTAHRDPWLVRQAQRLYAPLLERALDSPKAVAAVAVLLLAAATGAYLATGKTFMPTMDEGDIIMQLEKLPSISLDASNELDQRIQKAILAQVPEVTNIVARTGADEIGLDPMGLNQTDVFMVLRPRSEWRKPDKETIIDSLRSVMAAFPGVNYTFTQPIEMRVSEMLTGVRGDLAIKIFGPDLGMLNRLAQQVEAQLKTVPGNRDVFTLTNEGVQYLKVDINRFATGHQKLTVDEIETDLRIQLEGRRVGTVIEEGRRTPLIVRGQRSLRSSGALYQNQNVVMPDGKAVPLSTVARIARVDGPVKIDRENGFRYAVVQSSVGGRDLVGFVDDAKAAVAAKVPLPQGYHLAWGGQFENQQRAAARLAVVVPIALALIFMLLFATFGSLSQAALIFANIPFAMVGGIVALWASGQYLSVPASVGFIALLGIAVLNGVVLMSTFNQLRDAGLPIDRVVRDGASRRLRPVLMTASIAAFGLVPLLFATGPGSEIQRPLAVVVIGGLVTSTALTLLILPLLYRRFGVRHAASAAVSLEVPR
ncbi:MAG: efflux RND transporter permease subunit, partial [Betaproteobacteria bacterium]|nr:efflux RND transporter permease subunit [Betaproteobacteria bacterium]